MVQRIGLLHRGRQALTAGDASAEVRSAAWSCALEAVVAVVVATTAEAEGVYPAEVGARAT